MDYAREHGVPVMMPVMEQDLEKPIVKQFWKSGVTKTPGKAVNRIDMSKFSNLLAFFRRRTDPNFVEMEAGQAPEAEEPYFHAERPNPHTRDPFSGSEFVFGLSDYNFRPFIERKDMSLVMFYESPYSERTLWAKTQLNKAARSTQRENHGYAAVNCTLHRDLCQSEGVCKTPIYKVYSRGKTISTIQEVCMFKVGEMKGLMENAPVAQVCAP